MRRPVRLIYAAALALALPGCGMLGLGGQETPSTVDRVAREKTVDPGRAADLINAHRKARGKVALAVDPELNRIAAETAKELARRDKLMTDMHTAAGLGRRLAGRYPAERAAENLGAGYPTLVGTVAGWKTSSHHNANLLNGELTRMGIGLALTDKGVFHSYWVLILAKPASRDGPAAGAGPYADPGPLRPAAPAGAEPPPLALITP